MEDLHTIRVQKLLVNVQKVFGRANVTIDFDQHFFLPYIPAVGRGCIICNPQMVSFVNVGCFKARPLSFGH